MDPCARGDGVPARRRLPVGSRSRPAGPDFARGVRRSELSGRQGICPAAPVSAQHRIRSDHRRVPPVDIVRERNQGGRADTAPDGRRPGFRPSATASPGAAHARPGGRSPPGGSVDELRRPRRHGVPARGAAVRGGHPGAGRRCGGDPRCRPRRRHPAASAPTRRPDHRPDGMTRRRSTPSSPSATLPLPAKGGGPNLVDSTFGTLEVAGP